MQITREDLNRCTVKLDVVCVPDEVKDGYARAFKRLAKQVRVPGFRPGHAPRHVVEPLVHKDEVTNVAADEIIKLTYKKVIEQEALQPHDTPHVNVLKIDETDGVCEYTLKVPLAPVVELGEYKGIPVEIPATEVTDADVDHYLGELQKRKGKREAVTGRGVQEGDSAVVNIKIEGVEGDGRNFMTIAGETFPGLDEAILGMGAEEMKNLELTFPDNFQEKDWAGKTLKTKVTIRSVSNVHLPELDDAFAQGLDSALQSASIDELKAKLKERLQIAKATIQQEYVNEQILAKLLELSQVEVPDTMWEQVADRKLQDLGQELQQKGQTPEQYAEEQGMTVDKLVENMKEEAKVHVCRAVLVREIFVKEKMRLVNRDYSDELVTMAHEFEMQPQDLLNALKKSGNMRELEFRAIFKKVTDFLAKNAEIKEVAGATA